MKFPFEEIEAKWKKIWDEQKVYKTNLSDLAKKIYALVMFIYPSGAKLHIGHWYNYGPTDSWARFKKLQGYNVFEPMGYDAFGLPAENYAIKTGVHPYDSTMKNIEDIREQLKSMGCMYDWDSELMTCIPEYYKWNQWLFLKMYEKGLAYRKAAPVNWCPSCQTVLANEQVQNDGTCERCSTVVEQKNLTQWFFKITDYAEELLSGLDKINWPEETKTKQRNWIGKSFGTELDFQIVENDEKIRVFTTRPDTLFGVTYVVVSPEHSIVEKITTSENLENVRKYQQEVKSLSEYERTSTTKKKTGVPTGSFAVNPVNGEKVPIWVADYVLVSYGTGCVMAVPAHDERDFEFAKTYNLPIRKVILENGKNSEDELTQAFTEIGIMINSGKFDGIDSISGKKAVTEYLAELNAGEEKINYRLRDWLISRQRYWGTPIPIIHCEKCGEVPVPENQLPIELPYDVDFTPKGGSPLATNPEFVHTTCPKCGEKAHRDVDTMDTFVDSSWYYLRYLNPKFSDGMFDETLGNNWTPVDTYVGGKEHSTMHLLYARFIHKFLRDLKMVNSDEPFTRLIHQGTITNAGAKMSKSRGNVVNPNSFINQYGSDVFRMYMMFMGPYEDGGDWSDKGIVGVDRFAQKVYQFYYEHQNLAKTTFPKEIYQIDELSEDEKALYRKLHRTLDKYKTELEDFKFNTVVAGLMELLNEIQKRLPNVSDEIKTYILLRFSNMIAPLAPHLGEETWQLLGNEQSIFANPKVYDVDKNALSVDEVTIMVQVNGKPRSKFDVSVDLEENEFKQIAYANPKIKSYVEGKQIVKEIYIKNRIFNIVVR